MSGWVYIRPRGENLYTVGFYAPDGTWHTDSDHDTKEEARERVHYLNGGGTTRVTAWALTPPPRGHYPDSM